MLDLTIGMAIVLSMSAVLFLFVDRLVRERSRRLRSGLAMVTVIAGAAYLVLLWNSVTFSRLLPVSSLVVLSNWLPLFGSVLMAVIVHDNAERGRIRQLVPAGVLAAICMTSLVWPVMGASPECGEKWRGETCLQTTPVTCSAASAATLLKAHGIPATEQEMARLCLTRENGTGWMGLYRGLSLKTRGTPWRVEVVKTDVESLRKSTDRAAILFAELKRDADDQSQLRKACGWVPGRSHAVVFFEFMTDELLRMGDPSMGAELWRKSDLETLWSGELVRLVRR